MMKIIVTKGRAKYLLEELDNSKITTDKYIDDTGDEFVIIKIDNFNEFDLLAIFHAGVECGAKHYRANSDINIMNNEA